MPAADAGSDRHLAMHVCRSPDLDPACLPSGLAALPACGAGCAAAVQVRARADGSLGLVEHDAPAGTRPVGPSFGGRGRRPASDPLLRALGSGRGARSVLDATAGLGRDAATAAAAGMQVRMVERHAVLHGLLEAALAGAAAGPDAADSAGAIHAARDLPTLAASGDARLVLAALADEDPGQRPDTVYLDPMYGPREGRRGAPGRDTAILRLLHATASDGGHPDRDDGELPALLAAALRAANRRVVVKRHPRAPALAVEGSGSVRPVGAVRGLSVRFDLYAPVRP